MNYYCRYLYRLQGDQWLQSQTYYPAVSTRWKAAHNTEYLFLFLIKQLDRHNTYAQHTYTYRTSRDFPPPSLGWIPRLCRVYYRVHDANAFSYFLQIAFVFLGCFFFLCFFTYQTSFTTFLALLTVINFAKIARVVDFTLVLLDGSVYGEHAK